MQKKINNKKAETLLYGYIGQAYRSLSHNEKAKEYYTKECASAIEMKDKKTEAYSYLHLAYVLDDKKDKKEILENYQKALRIFSEMNLHDGIFKTKSMVFSHYRLNKNYDQCLALAPEIVALGEKGDDDLSHFYIEMGEIYTNLGKFSEAENYFDKAESILDKLQLSKKYFLEKKSLFESKRGNLADALALKEKEAELSKKEINKDIVTQLATLETRYKVAEKEKQLQSHKKTIHTEISKRKIILWGIFAVLLIFFAAFLFYRKNRISKELEMEKTLQELKNNLVILEMSNLNKQLDPHEIKNLIANISPEIQEKAPESYRKMLKLFNITKAALNNNSITDSIKNQTLQIDDFLGLEKQMLTVPLHYSIENNIQNPELQIPRLMLKNLVENAVKHGIKGNENGGTIHVALTEKAGFINIVVDDTGKGRKNAIAQDSGIGTSTYQNLFATLNMKNKEHASFEITDKKEGTKVVVVIPKEYKYE